MFLFVENKKMIFQQKKIKIIAIFYKNKNYNL
jgi:hypothetical protein